MAVLVCACTHDLKLGSQQASKDDPQRVAPTFHELSSFDVAEEDEIDVVLVMDSSGSMSRYWDGLTELPRQIGQMDSLDTAISWRFGALPARTTPSTAGLVFSPHGRWVRTADEAADLGALLPETLSRVATTDGQGAVLATLAGWLDGGETTNQPREGAHLLFVVVANSADGDLEIRDRAAIAGLERGFEARRGEEAVLAIVPQDLRRCMSGDHRLPWLEDWAESHGGSISDLCIHSFPSATLDYARAWWKQDVTFEVAAAPRAGDLVVEFEIGPERHPVCWSQDEQSACVNGSYDPDFGVLRIRRSDLAGIDTVRVGTTENPR